MVQMLFDEEYERVPELTYSEEFHDCAGIYITPTSCH